MSRSELQTRKEIIDRRLLEAGWNVMDRTQVIQELSVEVGLPGEVNCYYTNGHTIYFWDLENYPAQNLWIPHTS